MTAGANTAAATAAASKVIASSHCSDMKQGHNQKTSHADGHIVMQKCCPACELAVGVA